MARLPNQSTVPGVPEKPPGLSRAARVEWDRLVRELQESSVAVTKFHGRLIEAAVILVLKMEAANKTVETKGAYFTNPKTGAIQLHPAARRADSLHRDYIKVLSALGLRSVTPRHTESGKSLEDVLDE